MKTDVLALRTGQLGLRERLLLEAMMFPARLLVRLEGSLTLPASGMPVIVACNHNNALESLLVPVSLMHRMQGVRISFVIDWMYGKLPVVGKLMDAVDPVYTYTKRSTLGWLERMRPAGRPRSVLELCLDRLREGRSVGIFPEGRRNHDPWSLLRGKPGIGHLALSSGVPVLPVGIEYPAIEKKSRIPAVGRTVVRIGDLLSFGGASEEYLQTTSTVAGRRQMHRLAEHATHQVMLELSRLCGKRYPFASSTTTEMEELCHM